MKKVLASAVAGAAIGLLSGGAAVAAPTFIGPNGYLSFADSPFGGVDFSLGYFHLETFEDHALNTPGVTAPRGNIGTASFSFPALDSVDGDDGVIDGQCSKAFPGCDSWVRNSGPQGIRFNFNGGVLGDLPTHVGLVWTDGANSVIFEAFDVGGMSLGTIGPSEIAGENAAGSPVFNDQNVSEDSFFGVIDLDGIAAIEIRGGGAVGPGGLFGIEVDHLQYGLFVQPPPPPPPPPPTSISAPAGIWFFGAVALMVLMRRVRQ